jgi:hypothetical protein
MTLGFWLRACREGFSPRVKVGLYERARTSYAASTP